MQIRQLFTCKSCQKTEDCQYPIAQSPRCCGSAMTGGEIQFPPNNDKVQRLHLIKLLVEPVVTWQLPDKPNHIFELWKLAPGRAKGERIGWIGTRQTTVEWRSTPGVAISGGFANTIEEAAGFLLEALDGGIFAAANIQSSVVS